MTTNISQLPKIDGSQTEFVIANNADWNDALQFTLPGYPASSTLVGAITSGSPNVTVSSTVGLAPGQLISAISGIPGSTFIGAISSATQFSMVDINGNPVNAIATNAEVSLTFSSPALDISGIAFIANLRKTATAKQSFLTARTRDNTMTNGGNSGALSFSVPESKMSKVPAGSYVMDILAVADGMVINLFPEGPASVTVVSGVSDPALA